MPTIEEETKVKWELESLRFIPKGHYPEARAIADWWLPKLAQAHESGRQQGIKEACEKLRMEKVEIKEYGDLEMSNSRTLVFRKGWNNCVDELNNRIKEIKWNKHF